MIRRLLLATFGVLDVVLFLRFRPGPATFQQLGMLRHLNFLGGFLLILRLLFIASLAISAVGFFYMKWWALVLSYIQFPFRFLFVALSFGFLSLLSHVFGVPGWYGPLLYAAMVLECARLAATAWIQWTLNTAARATTADPAG